MSLYGIKTIDEIAEKVWFDLHDRDDSKRLNGYQLDIRTNDELYIVAHALIVLINSMDDKSADHAERVHPKLLKDIKALQDRLYQHGFVDEAIVDMAKVHSAVKQSATLSAQKQAKSIANFVQKELVSVGTGIVRANNIRSFIKDAMIVMSQKRPGYEKQLNLLSQSFTFLISPPIPTS